MAKRGPKHKPTALKLVQGTLRKGRVNEAEPQPDPALPDPPAHLCADALTEWRRVAPRLLALGVISRLDRAVLAAYCQAYGRWVQAEEALERFAKRDPATRGLMIKTQAGNAIQNPLVGAANKAMADMQRFAAELGITPASRASIRSDRRDRSADERFFT